MRLFGKGPAVPIGAGLAAASFKPVKSAPDLSWVPGFWAQVRDYIFVREEDEVVILPPNMVYKTNRTGIAVLRWIDSDRPLASIPGMDNAKLGDIENFLGDIRDLYDGKPVSTSSVPYDFQFTRLPILGELAVTYRCNNACRFCYAGCQAGSVCGPGGCSGESSLADMKHIVDIFRDKAKIPFFSLTGGEPLMRADLEELIAYAVSRRLRVNLITNATLAAPERAASLYAAGLRTAQVSLESPEASIHDGLCGRSGAHAQTLSGIEALQSAGISVQTNSTVTKRNRISLLAVPAFLAGIGVKRFSMNLYIPAAKAVRAFTKASAKDSDIASELFVSYSEIGPFVDEIAKRASALGLTFFWYSPTPLCIFNPLARGLGNKSCAAADGLIHVDPEGKVLPCSSYPEVLGSLLEQDFSEVWFSKRAAYFKNKRYAPSSCAGCGAFTACQAACPLYWDYAGSGELDRVEVRKVRSRLFPAGQAR
ncbi:MAG: radical SAM protein [Spirochaetes bacterium]|nr:radical SAM protein [Spirochaetota bacterium]